MQVLFDIHNVLSSSVSGIDIAFTCNDEAATVLLRGNNCSYAVVTPQRVVEYDEETLKKEELKEFIRKILRDRSRNYSKPAT
ncbi:hypothetical protein FRX31_011909 [Thalictrum thalictroides]|uniref:Uncharacterized protein n=1 Tax=Thalictrum thalictroides TaxID=46969 RepID=A0A7J6WMB6_THATH|nr:hypothetical protein FRX31_011909 [Thalictrum thalictroides]